MLVQPRQAASFAQAPAVANRTKLLARSTVRGGGGGGSDGLISSQWAVRIDRDCLDCCGSVQLARKCFSIVFGGYATFFRSRRRR